MFNIFKTKLKKYGNLSKTKNSTLESQAYYNTPYQDVRQIITDKVINNESEMTVTFPKSTMQDFLKWEREHIIKKHGGNAYSGCCGGRFTYSWVQTSLGKIYTITCSCGEKYTDDDL